MRKKTIAKAFVRRNGLTKQIDLAAVAEVFQTLLLVRPLQHEIAGHIASRLEHRKIVNLF